MMGKPMKNTKQTPDTDKTRPKSIWDHDEKHGKTYKILQILTRFLPCPVVASPPIAAPVTPTPTLLSHGHWRPESFPPANDCPLPWHWSIPRATFPENKINSTSMVQFNSIQKYIQKYMVEKKTVPPQKSGHSSISAVKKTFTYPAQEAQ
jgi:hypothetical protein